MNLAGHSFDERDLIRRALRNMKPRRGERNVPRWLLVENNFGVGSTVANALCHEFDLDPDEVIK
jgi:hypothetical protein